MRPTTILLSSVLASVAAAQQSEAAVNHPALLRLQYQTFDPAVEVPTVPVLLAAPRDARLLVVQFASAPTAADRELLALHGLSPTWYLPDHAYLVRGDLRAVDALRSHGRVRFVGAMQPAYKLDPETTAIALGAAPGPHRCVIVMVDPKRDEAALVAAVRRVGGAMWRYAAGNLLIEADLSPAQIRAIAQEDTVLWIQQGKPIEVDMDQARIQGGADAVEAAAGLTGKGVRGHIMEGIWPAHPEFAANAYRTAPQSVFSGAGTNHGNSTFGEIFAAGVNPLVRGLIPDGQGYFTNYDFLINTPPQQTGQNSRYGVVQEITNPAQPWRVMFQTASWGNPVTTAYEARAAEMDWIIHQFDLPITQSQSNTNNNNSRPQAWAKNIISVGAIRHLGTAVVADDLKANTSTGPAADGRIKPDLCGYFDGIDTTNGQTSYTSSFSGTSGATPMVAGHLGLLIEMFTNGYYGHPAAPTWQDRFDYKPHFATAKALLINTARQYDPAVNGADAAARIRQGWGFPSVEDAYTQRNNMLVLDEADVLQQGQVRTYFVHVKANTPQFRTTMVYADLPAAPNTAGPHRINDLSLRVVSPSGTIYHGNTGMGPTTTSLFTTPGGSPNTLDTVENVYVQNPASGLWRVEVSAPLVVTDQHLETPAVDADFALVCNGIGGGRDLAGPQFDMASTGPGNLSFAVTGGPASYADGFVLLSLTTNRPRGMGNIFGLEADALSQLSLQVGAAEGDPLHFAFSANPAVFPNAPFVFPPAIAALVSGATLDGVVFWQDAGGAVVAASNVDRVTVQ
jgi:serine protease AprX